MKETDMSTNIENNLNARKETNTNQGVALEIPQEMNRVTIQERTQVTIREANQVENQVTNQVANQMTNTVDNHLANHVRPAKRQDIPAILELLVQVDMVHHNGRPDLFKGPTTKYDAAQLETILEDETTPVFVCVDETGRVLGHAFCIHKQILGDRVLTDVKTLYIDDICVDEAARGKGVGKALYRHVLEYARSMDCYNVTLNVWSCNPGAVKFYESLGLMPQKIGMEQVL